MFAVLHLAEFALQAVLRTEPACVAGQPAALFAGTGRKSVVLAANAAARAAGVEPGLSAPQAVARCAPLLIRTRQPAAEAEARATLLAVGFTLSPAIEDTAPGVCTADLRGADPRRSAPAAHAAIADLARVGLAATAGLAATPLLALYAARACSTRSRSPQQSSFSPMLEESSGLPLQESLAHGRTAGGNGDHVTRREQQHGHVYDQANDSDPGDEPESNFPSLLHITDAPRFLAPLPLAVADPPPELAGVFAHWGVRTLGDLTALPRDEIVRRFGAAGLELWNRAAGGAPRPLRPVALPREFSAAQEFEEPVETLAPLLFLLRRFLDRLALELRASQHVAAELALRLQLEDETAQARNFRLPEPTADPEILFRALHTHLESLTTAAAISALRLDVTPTRPLVRQQGLFEAGLRDPHGFAETLARVSALVGPDRLGTPQAVDTHRPDAVRLGPPVPVVPPAAAPPLHPPLAAPLRRFRPPLPARVEFTAGRATYLWTDQVSGEIARQSNPWPASGDWWEPALAWSRVEWDIALANGGLYRLLLLGGSYFLEGEYD